MSLKFFFGECVDEDVAAASRAHRVDVVTTTDMERKGISDKEQLAFAYAEGHVIYTIDHDFLRLADECLEQSRLLPELLTTAPASEASRRLSKLCC